MAKSSSSKSSSKGSSSKGTGSQAFRSNSKKNAPPEPQVGSKSSGKKSA